MDAALGLLLDSLEDQGLLRHTWVILVSDHGEMLGERDMYMHGRTLQEVMVRVPLLVRAPSGEPGTVEELVSLIDLAPTRSLRPLLEGGALPARPVVAELFPVRSRPNPQQKHFLALRRGGEKYLMRVDGSLQRFDLASDPGEQRPLEAGRERFDQLLGEAGARFDVERYTSRDVPEPSAEMREALKDLGYLH